MPKHGAKLEQTRAMTVRVSVVDDEPDVEALFRQQFRREVRKVLYTLDFALSALGALAILVDAARRSSYWFRTSTCPG
jgi:hypothetical protein